MDKIEYIKERYELIPYAQTLGCDVHKDGDRCKSYLPGSENKTAMIFHEYCWHDFKADKHGDVIDLCALVKYGGDKGKAIAELGGDFGHTDDWKQVTQDRCNEIAYYQTQLRECDIAYLKGRGLTDETIKDLKLGYNAKTDRLVIPYFKNGYVAYWIARDRSGDPNQAKYVKMPLDEFSENIPWGLQTLSEERREWARAKHPDKAELLDNVIVIAEGAFDAISFYQEGFQVLSPISGYFNSWQKKQVLGYLKEAEYVFVCFDNDSAGKGFTKKFCDDLFAKQIDFVCGKLPEKFKDVSEFYAAGGDLFTLVENAESGLVMLANSMKDGKELQEFLTKSAIWTDEARLREFCNQITKLDANVVDEALKRALRGPNDDKVVEMLTEKYKLMFVEKLGYYQYLNGIWVEKAENYINGLVKKLIGHFATGSKLTSVQKVLKADISSEQKFNLQPIFNFPNGVLEVETGKFREHKAIDYCTVQTGYDYDPEAKCEKWDKFIFEIMNGNEQQSKLLQEMAGYVLVNSNKFHKAFFLIGDGANGKSVFLDVLTSVFGKENVTHVEMSNFINEFQLVLLSHSLVNISTEVKPNQPEVEAVFKAITAGDPVTASKKFADHFSFNPRCVLISACNDFVKSRDLSDGFLRRLIFILFTQKFEGEHADNTLSQKLKGELPGIFNWVYEGYKRLIAQNHFTETEEHKQLLEEYKEVINPIISFIQDSFLTEPPTTVFEMTRQELYAMYKRWAEENGHQPMASINFTRQFKQFAPKKFPFFKEYKLQGNRGFKFAVKYLPTAEDLIN